MQEFAFSSPPTVMMLGYGLVGVTVLVVGLALGFSRTKLQRILAVVLIAPVVVIVYYIMVAAPARSGVSVGDSLVVKAPPYARGMTVTREQVISAKVVDYSQEASLKPSFKTNGAATGTYRSGWFNLTNGKKALLLTNTPRVLCLELQDMYVLVAPDDFEGFVQAVSEKFVPVTGR